MQLRHSRPLLKQQQMKTITANTTITPMTAPIMISLVSPFSVKTTVCASCNWKLQFLIEIEQKFDFCTLTRYKAEEKRAKSKTHRISGFGTILGSIHVILICFRSFSSKSENCKVQETNQNQGTHKKLHFSFFRFFFFFGENELPPDRLMTNSQVILEQVLSLDNVRVSKSITFLNLNLLISFCWNSNLTTSNCNKSC